MAIYFNFSQFCFPFLLYFFFVFSPFMFVCPTFSSVFFFVFARYLRFLSFHILITFSFPIFILFPFSPFTFPFSSHFHSLPIFSSHIIFPFSLPIFILFPLSLFPIFSSHFHCLPIFILFPVFTFPVFFLPVFFLTRFPRRGRACVLSGGFNVISSSTRSFRFRGNVQIRSCRFFYFILFSAVPFLSLRRGGIFFVVCLLLFFSFSV